MYTRLLNRQHHLLGSASLSRHRSPTLCRHSCYRPTDIYSSNRAFRCYVIEERRDIKVILVLVSLRSVIRHWTFRVVTIQSVWHGSLNGRQRALHSNQVRSYTGRSMRHQLHWVHPIARTRQGGLVWAAPWLPCISRCGMARANGPNASPQKTR